MIVFGKKDVLGLEVTMQHLLVVDVVQPQTQLAKPVQYLALVEELLLALGLLNFLLKVAFFSIVHYNTQLFLKRKRLMVLHHVGMVEGLENCYLVVNVLALLL